MASSRPPPPDINIITLNCWGLKYISKLRNERVREIAIRLQAASPRPDIVAFQELFCQEDFRHIREATRQFLPYGKFYHGGAFGSGLAILSAWPIEESSMFGYPLNGRPAAFWRGDWYVGKGIACAKIRYGDGEKEIVEVFNTHTHAPYEDSYNCHRLAQSWAMAKHLKGAYERGHLVIGLGDFNMRPRSLHHRIITSRAPVRDVWRVLHPDSAHGAATDALEKERHRPVPSAEFNVLENGATSDSPFCTWRWNPKEQGLLGEGKERPVVAPHTPDRKGKRLDYIFYGDGMREATGSSSGWVVKAAKVGMIEPHPRLGCSVSDHFSVEATLGFHTPSDSKGGQGPSRTAGQQHGNNNRVIVNDAKPVSPNTAQSSSDGTGAGLSSRRTATTDQSGTFSQGTYLSSPTGSDGILEEQAAAKPQIVVTDKETQFHEQQQQQQLQNRTPQRHSRFDSQSTTPSTIVSINSQSAVPIQPTPRDLDAQLGRSNPHPVTSDNEPLSPNDRNRIYEHILSYIGRQERQQKYRSAHFFASVAVWVAALIAIWFIPSGSGHPYASFVFLLVVSLGLVAGTVDGLMALLFFRSERQALREFEWEVMNANTLSSRLPGQHIHWGG